MPTNGPLNPSTSIVLYGSGMPDEQPWWPAPREPYIPSPPSPITPTPREVITYPQDPSPTIQTIALLDEAMGDTADDHRKFRELVMRIVKKELG